MRHSVCATVMITIVVKQMLESKITTKEISLVAIEFLREKSSSIPSVNKITYKGVRVQQVFTCLDKCRWREFKENNWRQTTKR